MRSRALAFAIVAAFCVVVCAGSAFAADLAAPALTPGPTLHAQAVLVGGAAALPPGSAKRAPAATAATQTLLDSFTGATGYTTTTGSPRTFMGEVFTLASPGGTPVNITAMTVYLAYTGASAQVYNTLRVSISFWDAYAGGSTPIFSNQTAAGVYFADVAGPITLNPNTYSPIAITLATPATFTGLTDRGIAVNYQGDTGSGLASNDVISSLLRYGAAWSIGSSSISGSSYGYRNASGRTDFNFASTDLRGFAGQTNQGVALILQGDVATPVTLQRMELE